MYAERIIEKMKAKVKQVTPYWVPVSVLVPSLGRHKSTRECQIRRRLLRLSVAINELPFVPSLV